MKNSDCLQFMRNTRKVNFNSTILTFAPNNNTNKNNNNNNNNKLIIIIVIVMIIIIIKCPRKNLHAPLSAGAKRISDIFVCASSSSDDAVPFSSFATER